MLSVAGIVVRTAHGQRSIRTADRRLSAHIVALAVAKKRTVLVQQRLALDHREQRRTGEQILTGARSVIGRRALVVESDILCGY